MQTDELEKQVLEALKNKSSKNPSNACELAVFFTVPLVQIHKALDALIEKRSINQATVTRIGITQREVWPTGVEVLPPYGRGSVVLPPRRDVTTKPAPAETPIAEKPTAPRREHSVAWQAIHYIEANPDCTTDDLRAHLKVSQPAAYLNFYLRKGIVIQSKNGQNLSTWRLKDGTTADEVFERKLKDKPRIHRPIDDKRSTSQIILDFIAKHPDCGHGEIVAATGIENPHGYLKSIVGPGRLILTETPKGKRYRIAEGKTVEMIYKPRGKYKTKHDDAPDDPSVPVFLKKENEMAIKNEFAQSLQDGLEALIAEQKRERLDLGGEPELDKRTPLQENESLGEPPPLDCSPDNPEWAPFDKALQEMFAKQIDDQYEYMTMLVKSLLNEVPNGCHITLRHPAHENIRVQIDGTLLANPIEADLDKLPTVFAAIKSLQEAAYL